jgi:phage-related protein
MTITISTEDTDLSLTNDEGTLSITIQSEEGDVTCQIDDVAQLQAAINFVMQQK